ncbi:MAG: hypothetical protein ACLGRW_08435, partial [Acidobacteriota bacterium]
AVLVSGDKTPKQVNGLRLQVGPIQTIERGQFRVAKSTGKSSIRQRDLPAQVVVLGWTPRLRQLNKTLFAVRCKFVDRQDHCTAF